MSLLQFLVPLGWVETIGPILPLAILTLTIANMATRLLSHRTHKQQAEAGEKDEALSRYFPHTFTTLGVVLLGLLFIVYRPISGMIMMISLFGLLVTDFFEFEARLVEARNDMPLERPKAGFAVSVLALIYASYYGLQFLYGPYLDLIFA